MNAAGKSSTSGNFKTGSKTATLTIPIPIQKDDL